jgi:hypothetical protein
MGEEEAGSAGPRPETQIAISSSVPLIQRVLGPTADYLGEGLRGFTEHRVENLRRIFAKADRKLGDAGREEGQVPPRVLGMVIEDGSYCDDEFAAEYIGGVLASSRSGVSRDDRGAAMVGLIGGLSSYLIRAHYVLYESARRLLAGNAQLQSDFGTMDVRINQGMVHMPWRVLSQAMELGPGEGHISEHLLNGLLRHELIEPRRYAFGTAQSLQQHLSVQPWPGVDRITEGGLLYVPSPFGLELFGWAHGMRDYGPRLYFNPDLEHSIEPIIDIPDGAVALGAS